MTCPTGRIRFGRAPKIEMLPATVYPWQVMKTKLATVTTLPVEVEACGVQLIGPSKREPIVEMARRFVRYNRELIERLASA